MTSHDGGPRTSKPSSLPKEPDSRILRGYCGVKELSSPGPLHTGPKAHTEGEEMPKDEKKRVEVAKRHSRGQSCPRPTKIVRRKSGMPLNTASQRVSSKKD